MKKLLSIFLSVLLLITALPVGLFSVSVSAETGYTEGYHNHTVADGSAATVDKSNGSNGAMLSAGNGNNCDTHTFSDSYDKDCNVCGAVRTMPAAKLSFNLREAVNNGVDTIAMDVYVSENTSYFYTARFLVVSDDELDPVGYDNGTFASDDAEFNYDVAVNGAEVAELDKTGFQVLLSSDNLEIGIDSENGYLGTYYFEKPEGCAAYTFNLIWLDGTNDGYNEETALNDTVLQYDITVEPETEEILVHVYDSDCDEECNVCFDTREPLEAHVGVAQYDDDFHWEECEACLKILYIDEHEFDNDCDDSCSECEYIREVEDHVYTPEYLIDDTYHWIECTVCGELKTKAEHSFDNDCDNTCDECGYEREVEDHEYADEYLVDDTYHWEECLICGHVSIKVEHIYDNACDSTCDECGYEREVPDHVYDNNCDADCNICGTVREVGDHVYDDTCDTDCNECGAEREITHTYDNACDAECNVCGEKREVSDHVYDDEYFVDDTYHWEECLICGHVSIKVEHIYDNACDSTCDECGYEREVPDHVYDNNCDADCNICGTVREVGDHVYDDTCDTDCNECGAEREITHTYDNACDAECNVCGEKREVPDHVYDNELDADCNECGHIRELYEIGDINADGSVDTLDLAVLKLYLVGATRFDELELLAADIDGDLEVNTTDLARLMLYLAGAAPLK